TISQGGGCTFTLSPATTLSIPVGGGADYMITITALPGCTWSAIGATDWLSITSGSTGNGNGKVVLSATANPSGLARSAMLTIANKPFTVTQDGGGCVFGLNPNSDTVPSAGRTGGSVTVTASASDCPRTAVSNNPDF